MPEDDEERAHRLEQDDREGRTPAERSFHAVLHDLAPGGMHYERAISHGCDGSWIDDHDWGRIPAALIAAGWTPPGEDRP